MAAVQKHRVGFLFWGPRHAAGHIAGWCGHVGGSGPRQGEGCHSLYLAL
jgi:hypothetical protein